jgi:hypothetical protein
MTFEEFSKAFSTILGLMAASKLVPVLGVA